MVPTWLDDERGARLLRWTAALYGLAWAIHNADHLRRPRHRYHPVLLVRRRPRDRNRLRLRGRRRLRPVPDPHASATSGAPAGSPGRLRIAANPTQEVHR